MPNTIFDIRIANLRLLMQQWEGATNLAKKLGHANASFLVQLAGPNPRRKISEKVARGIEETLGLRERWLDESHPDAGISIDDAFLRECVRVVATCIRDARLTLDPDVVATLTSLAYEHAKSVGTIDKRFVQSLLDLTKHKH